MLTRSAVASAKGAVRIAKPLTNCFAPHAVLRVFLTRIAAVASCAGSLAAMVVCTWLAFHLGLSLGSVSFLYITFVVVTAFYGGLWQGTLISIVAVASLDYFFNAPVFSFRVDRFSDWVELGVFEFTALVISRLSNRAQVRALEAVAERRDTDRLYQAARRILLLEGASDLGNKVPSLICEMFELRGVVLFEAFPQGTYESGEPAPDALRYAREAFALNTESFDPIQKSWYCVLRVADGPVGALALCGAGMKQLTVTALSSLVAIALDRTRTLDKQYHAEAARQAEQLRTAVLDALAHQFKTPLAVIRTASSGLPAVGALSEAQGELVRLIDQEARKLNDLASRLVGARALDDPALDADDFERQPEPLLLSRLMKAALQELQQQPERNRFRIIAPVREPAVFADRELVLTALAQLADNALRYSLPDSPIDVGFTVQEDAVVVTIRSKGLVVPVSGTGLGLSIVTTIAADQHGYAWAEGEADFGTVFSLSLPVVYASAQ
jgi:two-component system sensor histidine kinase KdpD